MLSLGEKLRKARLNKGLSLDDLARSSQISKPYLSLIETGRVVNPPSDEKLTRLENLLDFSPGELVSQAHLHRTPKDIRALLSALMNRSATSDNLHASQNDFVPPGGNLDLAYLKGALHQLADRGSSDVEPIRLRQVPVINRVAAGYPTDFTDLDYPRGHADAFVGCPDLSDPDAFAARVQGDSMCPRYAPGDIIIFSPAALTRDGDDCFVRFEDGQTTFKRVYFQKSDEDPLDSPTWIRLQPLNDKYPHRVVHRDEVTGLYRAMFRYHAIEPLG